MRLNSLSKRIQRMPGLVVVVSASSGETRGWPSPPPTHPVPVPPANPSCTVAPAQQKTVRMRASSCGQDAQQRVPQRRAELPACALVIASTPEPPDTSQTPAQAALLLQAMNRRLLEVNPQYHAITTRLFLEDRDAMPQEQRALDQRDALLAQRNQLRDPQLHALLAALAPLQRIGKQAAQRDTALRTDSQDRMLHDDAQAPAGDPGDRPNHLAQAYQDAVDLLETLQDSAAPCALIQQLHCLLHDYRTLLA
ncbi:hypothetical protein [Xanthomonas campestris]|nr:hypothetical protein [Xanthomonas campestris]